MTVRGRFAPSPTGRLHLGNARTALLAFLHAKAHGGTYLLRIEDLDRARCRPEATEALLRDLEYLGLHWDEPPLFQSARSDLYRDALAKLSERGRTYDCFCSRAEIARAASAPHGPSDEGPRYPGTCEGLSPEDRAARARIRAPATRFRSTPGQVCFHDLVQGWTCQDVAAEVGDFVIFRNDGVASYQLAVVVDDAASGMTHVLRGEDLRSSTARQLQLFDALGLTRPSYAHVPLLLGPDGRRLAKREGALAVSVLRERGVPAEKVIGLLAHWCGLGDGGPSTAAALIPQFSLEAISRAPLTVTAEDISRKLGL